MVDHVSAAKRSEIMASVKSKDTGPELVVRKLLYRLGYRYRLHRKDLPGSPDIVFPGRKKALFVHGCFWHGHGCKYGKLPKSRVDYWRAKIEANRGRDFNRLEQLRKCGWNSLVIWQCELREIDELFIRIAKFLDPE